ncbi:MAG: MFS transporter, partial [Caulobacteraceae bacterium]
MITRERALSGRRGVWTFGAGCLAVTIGVILHLPMFLMAAPMGYRLAGKPMDPEMVWGMGLVVAGLVLAAYGILPRKDLIAPERPRVFVTPSEDAPLTSAHVRLMVVLVVALVVDVMKPASLGFVLPGMMKEYGVSRSAVAWLPFSALLGTFVGSIAWGVLADLYGRKASILLSAIIFVGTSICGAMPSLWWNVAMCFVMGAAAGGMLPATYALMAEVMPTKHRGWSLVLLGGLGAVGGYLLASGLSALLQRSFGWRIMWFLNLPTGLLLIALSGIIPESAKFLTMIGRIDDASANLRRFGSLITAAPSAARRPTTAASRRPHGAGPIGKTIAHSITAIAWGTINLGRMFW